MSTIIYSITLQVLRLSVTCLIMFFVRESCIKVVAVILLVNACSAYAEPPVSNYLPPNQDDKLNTFSSPNFNSNSQPIETSVSLTTSDPISPFFSSSSNGNGPNAPSNNYGAPNDFSSNRVPTSSGSGGGNNAFSQPPKRGQQSTGANKGYFYRQPSPAFNEPGGPTVPSQTGYPSGTVNPTGSSPTSSSYFSTSPGGLSVSVSPTYGAPQNTGSGFTSSGPGSPNREFGPSGNTLSTSYGPPSINGTGFNSPSTSYGTPGNTQASSQSFFDRKKEQPSLSTSYGAPSGFGSSLTNFPSSGNSFDLASNSLNIGNTSPGESRNPFSSYEPPSSGNRPSNAFGAEGTPQTLYGAPKNSPSRGSTGGTFGSPSPSYGPPMSSFAGGNNPQSFELQGNTGPSQNPSRPFDFTGVDYQSPSNQRQPSLGSSYGAPSPTASGTGYSSGRPSSSFGPPSPASQGAQNQVRPSTSYGPPDSNVPQGAQNQARPSASYGPPDSEEPQQGQNQEQKSPSYGASTQGAQNQARPTTSYGPPTSGEPQRVQNQGRPSASYNAPSQGAQNQGRPSSLYGPPSSVEPQKVQNQGQTSSSYGAPAQISAGSQYSQSIQNQGRPSSTYGAVSQDSPGAGFSQNVQNQARPSSSYGTLSTAPGTGYSQGAQNQARPSSSDGLPSQNAQRPGFSQNVQIQGRPSSPSNPSNSFSNSAPSSLYGPPSNNFNSPSNAFQKDRSSQYQLPSNNVFQPPSRYESEGSPQSSYGVPAPTSAFGSSGGAFPTSYELSSPSNSRPSSGTFSIQSSVSPSYSVPTSNSFDQGPSSTESTGYPAASSVSGFGANVSPTYESPLSNTAGYKKEKNPKQPSYTYGAPNQGSFSGQENSYTTPNSIDQSSNTQGNPPSSIYGAPNDQGNQRPTFGIPSSSNQPGTPSNSYSPSQSPSDFSSGDNSSPFSPSFDPTSSGFSGTQPEQDIFNTNVGSSYLPPSYSEGTGIPSNPSEDGLIPSTSYTLPGGQPNSSKSGSPNTLKNVNRNVGSDLITGASTSPFRPFNDDFAGYPASGAPSRANYEKSQEISGNELSSTGSDSSEPAKYEFNYNVKDAGTEFNHQESRNGSTTSGSYGVVLPDGRKQVVEYEANQEGFHPKIRYEESLSNSIQQNQGTRSQTNQGIGSTQSDGYNYSPANQPSQYPTNQPFGSQFSQPGSNYNQDLQPPYPSNSDYNQGSTGTQDSYPSNPISTSQSGYPDSAANFNTYKNQGTSPTANQEPFNPTSYQENQSSQFTPDSQGYNYSPTSDSNQPTVYDSNNRGYSSGPNKPGGKQIPFFS